MGQTMIEAIGQAIYEGRNGPGCRAWNSLPNAHKAPYLVDGKRALTVMRSPTQAMTDAAAEVDGLAIMPEWCSAIDAALAEG